MKITQYLLQQAAGDTMNRAGTLCQSHTKPMLSEAFFDRLLDQLDPHRPPQASSVRQAQLFCGRWIALRRLHLGLTTEAITAQTDLTAQQLLFLETGLAVAADLCPSTRQRLAELLADEHVPAGRIERIVAIALNDTPPDDQTIALVQSDLSAATPEPS